MKFLKALMATVVLLSATAHAETIKIRFWMPFAAGGPGDQQVRVLQKYLQEQNPNFVTTIEFKPGAGGSVGQKHFASLGKSEYVELLLDAPTVLVNRYLTKSHTLDLNKDLEIFMPIGNAQMLVLVPASSDINNIQGLRNTKKNPINYGSSGIGSVSHFTSAYLENYIDKPMNHIPYKGSGPVYPDLIAGRLDLFSVFFSSGIEQVAGNNVKAIAITGNKRHPRLPNVATLDEQGIKNFPIDPWWALFTNPNNDPVKQQAVQQALIKILMDKSTQKNYLDDGIVVDENAIRNPKPWFDRQITVFQNLAKDPKFANLESK